MAQQQTLEHEEEGRVGPRRWVVFTAAALLLVGVGVAMMVLWGSYQDRQDQQEAQAKAEELHAAFAAIGITAFDVDTIAHVLGSDGGGFCTDPAALVQATANLGSANGAAGPGMRPSVLDERRLQGDRLVIETYCPDQLDEFDAYVASLNLGSTTTHPGSEGEGTSGTSSTSSTDGTDTAEDDA